MPGYEKIESLKNGGSWGQFCWKTCGFERVKRHVTNFFFFKSEGQGVISPFLKGKGAAPCKNGLGRTLAI